MCDIFQKSAISFHMDILSFQSESQLRWICMHICMLYSHCFWLLITDNYGYFLTLMHLACFNHFAPKQSDHMWLCTSVTLAPKALQSCSNAQKTQQVL